MWCKTDGEKEDTGPHGAVGSEEISGSDGIGDWSEMVWPVLRRDDGHVLKKELEFEVKGKRNQVQPKKTWKMQGRRARVLV